MPGRARTALSDRLSRGLLSVGIAGALLCSLSSPSQAQLVFSGAVPAICLITQIPGNNNNLDTSAGAVGSNQLAVTFAIQCNDGDGFIVRARSSNNSRLVEPSQGNDIAYYASLTSAGLAVLASGVFAAPAPLTDSPFGPAMYEASEALPDPVDVGFEVIMQEPAPSAGVFRDIVFIILDPK